MRVLKNEKTVCCFTCIVIIELNLTIAFLLIRKTWDKRFAGKVGDFKEWVDSSNGRMILNWEG